MTTGAHDVAAVLFQEQAAAGRTMDKMQLQKLLYLVQGAHMRLWGEPAFRDELVAFERGPVVRGVEATYRDVVPGVEPLPGPLGGGVERVSDELRGTILYVLDLYGATPAVELEAVAKAKGAPWTLVERNEKIPLRSIAEWFRSVGITAPEPPTEHEQALLDRIAAGESGALAELLA